MKILICFIIVVSFSFVESSFSDYLPSLNKCDFSHLKPIENFDSQKFSGTWYIHKQGLKPEGFAGVLEQMKCNRVKYNLTSDPNVMESDSYVKYDETTTDFILEQFKSLPTNVTVHMNPEMRSRWIVPIGPITADVIILDTDYNTYVVSYNCVSTYGIKVEQIIVAIRSNSLRNDELRNKLDRIVSESNTGFIRESLWEVEQEGCT